MCCAIAAQVNPLKERVARLRQDVRERDELIVRLKADALLREQKIVELNHVINDWKCKVTPKTHTHTIPQATPCGGTARGLAASRAAWPLECLLLGCARRIAVA